MSDLVDADQLLFIIREYYHLEGEQGDAEREGLHKHLRQYLLLILKAYFTKVTSWIALGARLLHLYLFRVLLRRARESKRKT